MCRIYPDWPLSSVTGNENINSLGSHESLNVTEPYQINWNWKSATATFRESTWQTVKVDASKNVKNTVFDYTKHVLMEEIQERVPVNWSGTFVSK